MKIWLVEDEEKISELLSLSLRSEGFEVEQSFSFESARRWIANSHLPPDVVILDRMLHQFDSINLIDPIRKTFSNARIIVLSAISTAVERARALDLGADDYLGKPFSAIELLARIRALSRRSEDLPRNLHFKLGNLSVDIVNRLAHVDQIKLSLTNKEFLALHTLIETPGRVFRKSTLFERAWDINSDLETNVVESTMTSLRRKIEGAKSNVKIKNMRNSGYWIEI